MLYNLRASMMRKINSVREIFPKNKKLTISCFYCQMPGFGNYAIIHHFTPVFSNHRIELETYFLMNLFNNQTRVHTTLFTPVRPSTTDHTQNFPVIRSNRFSLDYMRAYACRAYLLSGIWAATSRSLVAGVRRVFKSMV